jgi:hypothetical protein
MKDLGVLPGDTEGRANSINDLGVAVGLSGGSHGQRAVLFENGQVIDLRSELVNSEGWNLTVATGINDAGQIVGWGTYQDPLLGIREVGFLLTPYGGAPVPEPSTFVMALISTSSLILFGIARCIWSVWFED